MHFTSDDKPDKPFKMKKRRRKGASFRGCKKRGKHMGRKYDDGGRKHVDQLVCDISSSTVKRPSPFANVSRHMARYAKTKGSSEDTHLPPSSFSSALINGMRYYGGWCSNGRVNGPRHLTPCNELGPAEGRGPFRPFSSRSSSCSQLR